MKVLTAAEMQACDRATAERFGVPSLELMRAAAAAVAAFARRQFPQAQRVTVLCGRGNNGGDGMMTARLLASAGLEVTTLLLGAPDGLKGDAAVAWSELTSPMHGAVHAVTAAEELRRHNASLDADLIVDAVLGTGFKPPMKGLAMDALEWIKDCAAPVLAVDLPSGWPADETAATIYTPVFPCDGAVTFTAPKPAHIFGQLTRRWDQPVVVAPIGSPDAAIVSTSDLHWAGSALRLAHAPRAAAANKGNFGHVLVVGGSVGRSGAPAMAALAALRAGAGLVTAAVPAPVLTAVASVAPELMTWALEASPTGGLALENLADDVVQGLAAGKSVLAIGPGLGQRAETVEFAAGLIAATKLPMVIDADGLNMLAADTELMAKVTEMARRGRKVVLTPHPGEMARLAGTTVDAIQSGRLAAARAFAERHGVTLVLKGARTLVAHPDGRVAVNTTGNPGMAKGGSGDVLTGLIAGMMAQHPHETAQAVEAAVYLHGLAADFAVAAGDEHTLLATDSLAHLAAAYRFRGIDFYPDRENGYVWLQGAAHGAALREGQP